MKRIIFFVLMSMSLFLANCGGPFVLINTSPNISSAFGTRRLTITNNTDYSARVTINCTEIAVSPGDTITSSWIYDFDYTQIPITARFFNRAGKYVGTSKEILYYYSGYNNTWVINNEDIEYLNNQSPKYPFPKPKERKSTTFEFPRVWYLSTTIIQIVNNTTDQATIIVNGKIRATLEKGDLYCAELQYGNVFDQEEMTNFTAIYGNRSLSQNIYSFQNQESAYSFILN